MREEVCGEEKVCVCVCERERERERERGRKREIWINGMKRIKI